MLTSLKTLSLFATAGLALLGPVQSAVQPTAGPEFTGSKFSADSQLMRPENYREWTFLTAGMDMSYNAPTSGQPDDMHMFDNVFVNPASYKAFVATGMWPDETIFVLEFRGAQSKGSINKKGNFQSGSPMGLEVHVKDARLPGGWGFFEFDDNKTAKIVPSTASCYTCHQAHAAVDTTFVQFYPTLLPIAESKGTLSAAYLKEAGAAKK
jgi:hypothetical protein